MTEPWFYAAKDEGRGPVTRDALARLAPAAVPPPLSKTQAAAA